MKSPSPAKKNRPPKARVKLPKARIAWAQDNALFAPSKKHFTPNPTRCVHPVVFVPCHSRSQAAQLARFANLTWEEKRSAIYGAIISGSYSGATLNILSLLGEQPGKGEGDAK